MIGPSQDGYEEKHGICMLSMLMFFFFDAILAQPGNVMDFEYLWRSLEACIAHLSSRKLVRHCSVWMKCFHLHLFMTLTEQMFSQDFFGFSEEISNALLLQNVYGKFERVLLRCAYLRGIEHGSRVTYAKRTDPSVSARLVTVDLIRRELNHRRSIDSL